MTTSLVQYTLHSLRNVQLDEVVDSVKTYSKNCSIFSYVTILIYKEKIPQLFCLRPSQLVTPYPTFFFAFSINPLNTELNPTCHLLALLGAHHILHVSMIRINSEYRYITIFLAFT